MSNKCYTDCRLSQIRRAGSKKVTGARQANSAIAGGNNVPLPGKREKTEYAIPLRGRAGHVNQAGRRGGRPARCLLLAAGAFCLLDVRALGHGISLVELVEHGADLLVKLGFLVAARKSRAGWGSGGLWRHCGRVGGRAGG